MAACGQTKAQMLHCVQFSLFHTGTVAAMARLSITVVPGGTKPPAEEGVHPRMRESVEAGRNRGSEKMRMGSRALSPKAAGRPSPP